MLILRVGTDILKKPFEGERAYRIWNNFFNDIFNILNKKLALTESGALEILKTNMEELITEKLTKTNTRGIVGNKSNKNSLNRVDLTSLLQIRLSLENNNNNSFVTLSILLFS